MASLFPSLTQFPKNPSDSSNHIAAQARAQQTRGLLRLFFDTLIESRQRETEQHVARLLARSGGKFTDRLEREAEHPILGR